MTTPLELIDEWLEFQNRALRDHDKPVRKDAYVTREAREWGIYILEELRSDMVFVLHEAKKRGLK